ncbi:tegument host shutoff protein [pteropodid alphaherpesvirus 2]|uniref:Virion host shutoff protein n=1 Tax=pteropodid alphaherpesvirus 2 TaxID=3118716 RepID=A0A510J9U2_9ALPH|nr:tegument host shutoff protein [pteropodid alphaherpesvirus 2]BBM13213.1 tegument host shutoff protein [pteropodid alphaherpesvirus 2]
MGLFGMMKFAHTHHLVKRRPLQAPHGYLTPIAVDLWNVMYTLVVKYQRRYPHHDRESITLRCLCSLLKVFAQRALFPIFVTDRGIDCTDHVVFGAKAILTRTTAQCKTDEEASDLETSPLPSPLSEAGAGFSFTNIRRRWGPAEAGFRPLPASKKSSKPALRLAHHFCIQLLRALGYAYINSGQMEADDACANLYHTNTVAYVHTTDTDLLLMGCDIVLDISAGYTPTIHCRDLLRYFKMSYPQFLALFVRCHTDLHPNNTHTSVEDVLRDCNWTPPSSAGSPHARRRSRASSRGLPAAELSVSPPSFETRISWTDILCQQALDDDPLAIFGRTSPSPPRQSESLFGGGVPFGRSTSEILSPPESVNASDEQLKEDHRQYIERRRQNIIQDAPEALDWLPEPMTITDIVERRYVKYVISLISPKRRGPWTLLKRLPIYQDPRDEELARLLVRRHISARGIADTLWEQLQESVPPPEPYQEVLQQFWDDTGSSDSLSD